MFLRKFKERSDGNDMERTIIFFTLDSMNGWKYLV